VARALALALTLSLVPTVAPAAPVVVRLIPNAVVSGEEILLSEVAEIEGRDALADRLRAWRIAPSPLAGVTQVLYADTVRTRLSSAHADAARVQVTGVPRVMVTRAAQTVRAADLVDAVRKEANVRFEGSPEPSALVPISRPEDLRVPTGALRLDVRLHDGAANAPTLIATISVKVEGRERHQLVMTFQRVKLVDVIVATRTLEPRRVLGADDFRRERRAAGEVPPDALADLGDAQDLELMRTMQPGEVLTPRAVRPRIAVKRGELVTLMLEGEGFRITTQGQASEDARRGDAVRVLNVSSKREVLGFVEGGGVVRVPHRQIGAER
jgi:flagellar basal body P-ring formation protein FlgA